MKNWIKGFAIGFLALGLAACSNDADTIPDVDKLENMETTDSGAVEDADSIMKDKELKEDEALTTEEVFEKAKEASENLKSMHAKMNIKQHIKAPDMGMDMESNIEMDMDIVQEPIQMHQVMKMDMGEEGVVDIELYMTEEGFFMKDPTSGTWMKLPTELYSELSASMSGDADPSLDLAQLEEYADDFTVEENGSEYILKLKASGDKFNALIQDQLSTMEGIDESATEVLENMTIHQLEYEIFIDKDTFNTTAFNMMMDMEMSEEGSTIRIVQDIKAEISQINEMEEIIVPQEVLDAAVEQ